MNVPAPLAMYTYTASPQSKLKAFAFSLQAVLSQTLALSAMHTMCVLRVNLTDSHNN